MKDPIEDPELLAVLKPHAKEGENLFIEKTDTIGIRIFLFITGDKGSNLFAHATERTGWKVLRLTRD